MPKKVADENLNSPGMRFEPLAFDDCCISPDKDKAPDSHANRFYIYGVIARLAILLQQEKQQVLSKKKSSKTFSPFP